MSMKLWEVVVKDSVAPEMQKKIKRLLKPVLSVYQPGKCLFCGTDTTWTINNKNVCPGCHVKYDFLPKDRIPDPCESKAKDFGIRIAKVFDRFRDSHIFFYLQQAYPEDADVWEWGDYQKLLDEILKEDNNCWLRR